MNFFYTEKPNANYVLKAFLSALQVKVNAITVDSNLENHPDYPSLVAFEDCLTEWNIANGSRKVNKEHYDECHLLFPLIAHFPENGGRFVLIHEIKNGQVYLTDENYSNENISESEFLERWDGIVLEAETISESGEKDFKKFQLEYTIRRLIIPGCILSIIIAITLTVLAQQFSIAYNIITVTKTIGLAISILLLTQSINANNPLIQNLCGITGKNNCNAILKSDAAKITDWLNWSEVGFFYFAGSLLALLFVPSSFSFLAWLNLFALPYTIYSISYQYKNKNWCILCCAVQLVLVSETIIFNSQSNTYSLQFSIQIILFLTFLSPILFWAFLKPFFLQAAEQKPLKHQLKKFKYNVNLFKQALTNQPNYSVNTDLIPIILGNPNAETIITMVSNPLCIPCAKAHKYLDELLKTRDDLQLKLMFSTTVNDDDQSSKVAKHAIALSLLEDKELVLTALNDWYAQGFKNYEAWSARYPVVLEDFIQIAAQKQKEWCDLTEITFTPTILINGYKLPKPYQLNDIKHLIS